VGLVGRSGFCKNLPAHSNSNFFFSSPKRFLLTAFSSPRSLHHDLFTAPNIARTWLLHFQSQKSISIDNCSVGKMPSAKPHLQEETTLREPTLAEFLSVYHDRILQELLHHDLASIPARAERMDPELRFHPEHLQPWTDFVSQHDMIRDKFASSVFAKNKHITPHSRFEEAGKTGRVLGLSILSHDAFSGRGTGHGHPDLPSAYSSINHVDFRAPPIDNRMAEQAMAGINKLERRPNMTTRRNLRPSRMCTTASFRDGDRANSPEIALYPISVMHPTVLTLPALQHGLRPMNFAEEIVAKMLMTTENHMHPLDSSCAEDIDRLVGVAVGQMYHFMIWSGVEYGLLATGENFVFFKVDWTKNPGTLYYHLAESGRQILPFTLMALEGTRPTQRQRHLARENMKLRVWDHNDNNGISGQKQVLEPPPPLPSPSVETLPADDLGPAAGSSRHAIIQIMSRPVPEYCTHECLLGLVNQSPLDPNCPNVHMHRDGWSDKSPSPLCEEENDEEKRKQVPQKKKQQLYAGCHPVNHAEWLRLLQEQFFSSSQTQSESGNGVQEMASDLYDGIIAHRNKGSHGVMLQVTLLKYGYTFVAKGTIAPLVPQLRSEARVYQHKLWPIQGFAVPVFLGEMDLRPLLKQAQSEPEPSVAPGGGGGGRQPFYYDIYLDVVYMIFLSWGGIPLPLADYHWDSSSCRGGGQGYSTTTCKRTGTELDYFEMVRPGLNLAREIRRSLKSLHLLGVAHRGVHRRNLLWSEEKKRVIFIDFERSCYVDDRPRRHPHSSQSVNGNGNPQADDGGNGGNGHDEDCNDNDNDSDYGGEYLFEAKKKYPQIANLLSQDEEMARDLCEALQGKGKKGKGKGKKWGRRTLVT